MNANQSILQDLLAKLNHYHSKNAGDDSEDIYVETMAYISRLKINCDEHSVISFREALCLVLLVMGNSVHQCADLLGIKYSTVQEHEKNTRRKLNANNRATAFYKACLNNYVSFVDYPTNF